MENPKDSTPKLLELIEQFSNVAGYKVNAQKSVAGRLGGTVVKHLPSAQGVIPALRDRAPHQAPAMTLLLPLPLPLLVFPLSLAVSISVE